MTPSVSTPISRRRHFVPFRPGEEVLDGDGFVAMRAGTAETDPGHEDAAVLATLFADLALAALGALVNGDRPARLASRQGRLLEPGLMPATKTGLATGIVAVAPAAGAELGPAGEAGSRNAIVTRRGHGSGRLGLGGSGPLLGQAQRGGVLGGVVGDLVDPAAVDDTHPGPGQDAHSVGMVTSPLDRRR